MPFMKLSIIIPTFNRVELLPRAIDSVFAQSSLPAESYEVIVVDDGSTDGTSQLIQQRYPAVKLVSQANKGVSAARNFGLRQASGEWIALLDSDDEWLPNKIEKQFERLKDSGLQVCHTEEIWVRNGVRVNQMNKHEKAGGDIFARCLPLCVMSPSSIVIHREIFEAVGLFDESLPACEDYDLWLRICARYSVAFVDQPSIIKYGGHEDQLSAAYWGMDRFRVRALEKLLGEEASPLNTELDKKSLVVEMLSKKNKILLNGAIKRGNSELESECRSRQQRLGLDIS